MAANQITQLIHAADKVEVDTCTYRSPQIVLIIASAISGVSFRALRIFRMFTSHLFSSESIRFSLASSTAILYGSEARGDARPDSDIDVLVLLEGEQRDFALEDAISGALYELELETGVLISPMILLRKAWENRPFKTPFYINVMNEGIRLC